MSVTAERIRGQVAEVLRALKAYRRLTDGQIGAQIGRSPQSVNNYLSGTTHVDAGMMGQLAEVFGVEPAVLFMTPDKALRWVLDNSPNVAPKKRRPPRSTRWYFQEAA